MGCKLSYIVYDNVKKVNYLVDAKSYVSDYPIPPAYHPQAAVKTLCVSLEFYGGMLINRISLICQCADAVCDHLLLHWWLIDLRRSVRVILSIRKEAANN